MMMMTKGRQWAENILYTPIYMLSTRFFMEQTSLLEPDENLGEVAKPSQQYLGKYLAVKIDGFMRALWKH